MSFKAKFACVADEVQASHHAFVVTALTAFGPAGRRKETVLLVEPNGWNLHPCELGQPSDADISHDGLLLNL